MNNSTREAFIVVLDAMIRHANQKIGGIKRAKYDNKDILLSRENKFIENCNYLKSRLHTNRLPLKFLRVDQHDRRMMRDNLNHILGEGHKEIENIVSITFD